MLVKGLLLLELSAIISFIVMDPTTFVTVQKIPIFILTHMANMNALRYNNNDELSFALYHVADFALLFFKSTVLYVKPSIINSIRFITTLFGM